MVRCDLLFAAWAGHECEGDSKGGPFVLEELDDAVCVESMATSKLGARLTAKFCCKADRTQLILVSSSHVSITLSTNHIEARQAS